MANQLLIEIYAFFITYAKIWIVGNVVESGAHSFLRFAGKPVAVHAQCKSTEYYFYHRPSITVENNIISPTTFDKIKKCVLCGPSKLFNPVHLLRGREGGGGGPKMQLQQLTTVINREDGCTNVPHGGMHEPAPHRHFYI